MNRAQHRQWEDNFIQRYGRKFTLSVVVVVCGFVVNAMAMVAVAVVDVAKGQEYTKLVDLYTDVLMLAVAAFAGADAFITMKTAKLEPDKQGAGPSRPPPRPSGTISSLEPEGG